MVPHQLWCCWESSPPIPSSVLQVFAIHFISTYLFFLPYCNYSLLCCVIFGENVFLSLKTRANLNVPSEKCIQTFYKHGFTRCQKNLLLRWQKNLHGPQILIKIGFKWWVELLCSFSSVLLCDILLGNASSELRTSKMLRRTCRSNAEARKSVKRECLWFWTSKPVFSLLESTTVRKQNCIKPFMAPEGAAQDLRKQSSQCCWKLQLRKWKTSGSVKLKTGGISLRFFICSLLY